MEKNINLDPRIPVNQYHVNTADAFKRLLGPAYSVDADYFRNKMVHPKEIGKLLKDTALIVSDKMSKLHFDEQDRVSGGTATVMEISMSKLYKMGENIEKLPELDDTDNYHWEIIGMLIDIIATQFEYIESRTI